MHSFIKIIRRISDKVYFTMIIVLSVLTLLAFGRESFVQKIKVGLIQEAYNTTMAVFPGKGAVICQYKFVWLILLLLTIILIILKKTYKRRIFIVEHFSFGDNNCVLDKSIKKEYWVKENTLDQRCDFLDNYPSVETIESIDKVSLELVKQRNKREIGYLGVAHIPLVFRFGFKVSNKSEIHCFHRMRENDECYKELGMGDNVRLFFRNKELNANVDSRELVVGIATSYKIKESEIREKFGNNKHVLILELNNIDVDILKDYRTIERMAQNAWGMIRDCEKRYNIKRLHIVMASSVAFTFFMGAHCSGQLDAKTIVYHYKNMKYTWGIQMDESSIDAIIK